MAKEETAIDPPFLLSTSGDAEARLTRAYRPFALTARRRDSFTA